MATIVRQNKQIVQRLGNNLLYGSGFDGDVTITSTVFLTRDMHYRNLTLSGSGKLFTNGYRVYVSGTLTVNSGTEIGTPRTITNSGSGTLRGRAADSATTKSYIIGPDPSLPGVSTVPAAVLKDIETVMQGWHYHPVDGFKPIEAAYDGDDGTDVTGSPAPTSGQPGGPTSGNPGAAGTYPPDANTFGVPGGRGNPGNPGTAGNAGATGTKGIRGVGGGLVVILAKTIIGSGVITSEGAAPQAPTTGATGLSGAAGTAGNPAPSIPSTTIPGNLNPNSTGHNPSSTGHNPATPGNAYTVPGNSYTVPGNHDYKENHNPSHTGHAAHVTYHHHHNDGYRPYYHNVKAEQIYHYQVHNPGNPNGTYHHYQNPSTTAHNPATTAHNPTTPGNAFTIPGNSYTIPGTHNPATSNPSYPGGAGGNAGAAGSGGAGGTGNVGTDGDDGAIFIVTDSISGSITRTAHREIVLVLT